MKVSISVASKRKQSDCLIIPFFEGNKIACDFKFHKDFLSPVKLGDFSSKKEEVCVQYTKGAKEKRILFLGLGKKNKIDAESMKRAYSVAISKCQELKVKTVSLFYPKDFDHFYDDVLESIFLTNYSFLRLKKETAKKQKKSLIKNLQILGNIKQKIKKIESIATGVCFVRDLVSNNADDETPQRLALVAKDLEKVSKNIKTTILDKKKIEKEKMGLLLAVNKGSFRDPYFIRIDYTPTTSKDRTVLIGKAITYDTGGLSLKPSTSMDTMKTDMSGGATVLGAIYVAAKLGIKKNITVLIPATENAISSRSYKPGDVYISHSGKSVEVENTDAEGRLILADAISYAVKYINPNRIINFATLTGAIVIALGDSIAGLFSNSKDLSKLLLDASKKTGEGLCELPLHMDYKKLLNSKIADIKNLGGRSAGSIIAALFLEEFANQIDFAHIDIGGTAYISNPKYYLPTQATGYGVRLLIKFLESL